jgi:hypothetical protein
MATRGCNRLNCRGFPGRSTERKLSQNAGSHEIYSGLRFIAARDDAHLRIRKGHAEGATLDAENASVVSTKGCPDGADMKKSDFLLCTLPLLLAFASQAQDRKAAAYPTMAPIAQYRISARDDEIALARSAAPASISTDAEVLVLGDRGYETAVKGKNGFVCFIQRSWAAGFDDPEFWNPKSRAPNCFNPPAARTVLPQYLKRTEWVLAGVSGQEMKAKTRSAIAGHEFKSPEPGALSFMLSKHGYVSDEAAGPWLPHVMFFVPHGQAAVWGAGLEGSPVIGKDGSDIESTVLFVPVRRWSDGSPAPSPAPAVQHRM